MIDRLLEQKQAVIFDLDGTLVDSMWMWHAIDIEYLGRFGLTCPPGLSKAIEGMSFTETACYFRDHFQLPLTVEEIKADWTAMSIEKYRTQVPLKKGARAFLAYIKGLGLPMGIATSNSRQIVDTVLGALKIQDYFADITTGCEVAMGKPAPDVYLKVAEKLHADPAFCLAFEDVPAGILAGKAAGMTVVAVEDRFSQEVRSEKEALADYFIQDYEAFFTGMEEQEAERAAV